MTEHSVAARRRVLATIIHLLRSRRMPTLLKHRRAGKILLILIVIVCVVAEPGQALLALHSTTLSVAAAASAPI